MSMDVPSLQAMLEQRYGTGPVGLHVLAALNEKHVYRVEPTEGPRLLLRAYPSISKQSVVDHAAMLQFLEWQGYPAPRVIPALDGSTVVAHGDWHMLLVEYIEGTPLDYAPASLFLLGQILGRLHALVPSTFNERTLPIAGMRPTNEIAWATRRLLAVESLVPPTLQSEYDRILAALRGVHDCEDLPKVIIHNDCHPGNAIRTANGQVILIDWEGAGWGSAAIDIGFLLVSCDTESPWTPRFNPDPERVRAMIDGYCHHHRLTQVELDRLIDTIRFRTIVYGAVCFAEAIAESGQGDDDSWWRERYLASDELASRARSLFERHLSGIKAEKGSP